MPPQVGAHVAEATPDVGWARLSAVGTPALSLLCELGEIAPTITQGYGGWNEVERFGRAALTAWAGFKPMGIDLHLMLDDFLTGHSIEDARTVLEAMAGRGERLLGGEPPKLIVDTAGLMPHDYHSSSINRWVIESLDWDEDGAVVNDYGNWTRVGVTVALLQFVDDQGLVTRSAVARARIKALATPARQAYKVKQGDTLTSIARAKLGDAGRWRELAVLNNIRDPRAPLKTGSTIRIP